MIQEKLECASLYQRIAEEIHESILNGVYQPGDRLPSIRELRQQWNCAQGTVQHAYQQLAQQGLVTSRGGDGTHVVNQPNTGNSQISIPLRKAKLVHRAEAFLLESFIAGYSYKEIEESMELARRHMQAF